MGTGHLDRRASGQVAVDILNSCDCKIRYPISLFLF